MGAPDQLAKRIFAEELPALFGDRVTFHPGIDIGFAELRLDGVLSFWQDIDTSQLPAPWSMARKGFITVEVKMPGEHVDLRALERAVLRRQALCVTLLEREPPVHDPVALWLVAPHLPEWLPQLHRLTNLGQGCYRIDAGRTQVLWMAANELPLHESLLPFLVTRSGKKLVELLRWLLGKRPVGFVTRVLEWSSMSPEIAREIQAEIDAYDLMPKTPEEREATKRAARIMLAMAPEYRQELIAEAVRDVEQRLREADELRLREREQAQREREQGLREAVADLCEAFGIALDDARRAHLASLDVAGLDALRVHLKAHRAWPG